MAATSKELLEISDRPPKPSFIESLLTAPKGSSSHGQKDGNRTNLTTLIPPSQVLSKAKDFLGLMAKANETLEEDIRESSHSKYDIEVLSGDEGEHIEMDLLLGVAELHNAEAVAAAEAAMDGFCPSKGPTNSSGSDTEDDSDEDNNGVSDESYRKDLGNIHIANSHKNASSHASKPNKRPKIVVLD